MIKYLAASLTILLLLSCSAKKRDFAVINDFLEYEMAGKPYDTIFIARQQVDNDHTVQLYEFGFKERLSYDSGFGRVWVEPLIAFWPMDEEQIEILKCESADTAPGIWDSSDFANKNFVFANKKELRTGTFVNKHISYKNHVFFLSEPMFDKTGNYAIFYYAPTSTGIGQSYPYVDQGLKLMKKEGRKWRFIANITEQAYK